MKLYRYDEFNRLIKYNDDGTEAKYTYGVDNLRATKTVNGATTSYVWNGRNLASETKNDTTTVYYYDPLGVNGAKTDNDTFVRYIKDPHGNVVATSKNSTLFGTYDYTAFGNQLEATDTTNPFRYCGEYYDEESGLIYLRNRYYNSATGRFITEDPIKDGVNWYVYCANNPENMIDPSGEDAIILTNENGADGWGHMGVLVQDCNGTWVYFSCGENYSIWTAVNTEYMSDLKTFSDNYYAGGTYTTSTYIKGDFTEACNYYYEYNKQYENGNNQYSLFVNNCSQVVMDGINKGKVYNGTNAGAFTNYYRGLIPNETKKILRKLFFNTAWNCTEYRKQLNDQLWEVTKGAWNHRSPMTANRICHLDYFEL